MLRFSRRGDGRDRNDARERRIGVQQLIERAQEAHEAIRPSDADLRPSAIQKRLTEDQFKLYDLIWKRAVASQMKSARVLKTEADIAVTADGKKLGFVATGKQVLFDGYQRLLETQAVPVDRR